MREISSAFIADRNCLAYARGLIDETITLAGLKKIPLKEALWELQWKRQSGMLMLRDENRLPYLRKGARFFKTVNPSYHFSPLLNGRGGKDWAIKILSSLFGRD